MTEEQFEKRKIFSLEQFEETVSSANNGHVKITWSEDYREYTLEIGSGSDLTKILFAQSGCTVWGGMCQLYITDVAPEDWQVHLIYANADTGEVKGDIHVPAEPADTETVTFDWLDDVAA
jgi:hypothetical protein